VMCSQRCFMMADYGVCCLPAERSARFWRIFVASWSSMPSIEATSWKIPWQDSSLAWYLLCWSLGRGGPLRGPGHGGSYCVRLVIGTSDWFEVSTGGYVRGCWLLDWWDVRVGHSPYYDPSRSYSHTVQVHMAYYFFLSFILSLIHSCESFDSLSQVRWLSQSRIGIVSIVASKN
jgi:hypothetical protein